MALEMHQEMMNQHQQVVEPLYVMLIMSNWISPGHDGRILLVFWQVTNASMQYLLEQHLPFKQLVKAFSTSPISFHLLIAKVYQVLLQVGFTHKHLASISHWHLRLHENK